MNLILFIVTLLALFQKTASMVPLIIIRNGRALIVRQRDLDASDAVVRAIETNNDCAQAIDILPDRLLHSTRNSHINAPTNVAIAYLNARALRLLLARGIHLSQASSDCPLVFVMRHCISTGSSSVETVISTSNESEYYNQLGQRLRDTLRVLIEYGADLTRQINPYSEIMRIDTRAEATSSSSSLSIRNDPNIFFSRFPGYPGGIMSLTSDPRNTRVPIGDFLATVVSRRLGFVLQQGLIDGLLARHSALRTEFVDKPKTASIIHILLKLQHRLLPPLVDIILDYLSFLTNDEDCLILTAENTIKQVCL